ncbi:MAG: hypothetical protein GY746_12835 [Gammaproteobacteria bacterium]|nr:hypothetical protein [Gammaproteobacteria bacterium]MCP4274799.1 hypothetical protein [Gammaproteobacteria bacterium]MCP4832200.1 hypothetical protein [Gammaproteobacteria bacterium]
MSEGNADDNIGCLIVLLIGMVLIWWWEPWSIFWDNETTAYFESYNTCPGEARLLPETYPGELSYFLEMGPRSYSLEKWEIRVFPGTLTISTMTANGPKTYQNCEIFDADNWSCGDYLLKDGKLAFRWPSKACGLVINPLYKPVWWYRRGLEWLDESKS